MASPIDRTIGAVGLALAWLGLFLPVIRFGGRADTGQTLLEAPVAATLLPAVVLASAMVVAALVSGRRRWAIAAILGGLSMGLALVVLLFQEGRPIGGMTADGALWDGALLPGPWWGFLAAVVGAALIIALGYRRARASV